MILTAAPPAAPRTLAMSVAKALFWGYVATLILAGAWGIFGAGWDQLHLLHLDVATLTPLGRACVLSQYRFLRAVECAAGIACARYHGAIFTRGFPNRLFLGGMAAGVVARLLSLALDGRPSPWFLAFLVYEAIGVVLIAWQTWAPTTAVPPSGSGS